MTALYWFIIFIVVGLMLVIAFKMFCITFGIPPVLFNEIQEFKHKKRILAGMVIVTVLLYIVALLINLMGGI